MLSPLGRDNRKWPNKPNSVKCHLLCIQPLVKTPPASPLPDPVENHEWYSETWIQYPFHDTLYSLNHPVFFKAKCDLSIILNQLTFSIFNEAGRSKPLPPKELKDFLERLGTWHFFLPQSLAPENIIFPFELNLQYVHKAVRCCTAHLLLKCCNSLTFYAAILSLGDFTSPDSLVVGLGDETDDIKQSINHSSMCFETLMRLYYLHHGYETPDGHMTHNLMILVYKSLAQVNALAITPTAAHEDSLTSQEAKSTLILAETGLYDQGQNYFLPRALFEIVTKEMSDQDKNLLDAHIPAQQEDSETVESRQRYISSQYPVKFAVRDAALQDPRERHLGQIVNEFMALAAKKAHSISSRTGNEREDDDLRL